jgi:tRNA threonylcarbamoyladenosine biosynthesis protein TsaB
MSLILHIDTAVTTASVCISKDGVLLAMAENKNQKDHAEWLHPTIDRLLKENGIAINDLNAVAVSNGPGSYTGLRVGLASAKGFCFALNIPLIAISTLEVMTIAALESQSTNQLVNQSTLFCPMIDARRMEVFTALYDKDLNIILAPHAKIIDEKSFEKELEANQILFFGNGAEKCKTMIDHDNALFATVEHNASFMIEPAERKMNVKDFADLAYAEPFYIKDFHTVQPKK